MAWKLLIVESPNKIKKLKAILGEGWEIAASVGHIRDLPLKELGIDKGDNYRLQYTVLDGKKEVVKNLQAKVKRAGSDNVFLATDPDREGEAISFHLCRELHIPLGTAKRVCFHEITEKAVKAAVNAPRSLDLTLVAAQESRRCIDRLVGYEVSPVLWKHIKGHTGLSAGRVQSVAVRLVVDREALISGFAEQYKFAVSGDFVTPKGELLKATLQGKTFVAEAEAAAYLEGCKEKTFSVGEITKSETAKEPPAPFSTSSFQQTAFKKLKLKAAKAMELAQKLFEAGLITYMRTDSVNISEEAITDAQKHISVTYGKEYFCRRTFKNKNDSAQEAHEAIRPTHVGTMSTGLGEEEERVYRLIYARTLASQMAAARYHSTAISIINNVDGDKFLSTASVLKFDGYLKAYDDSDEAESDGSEEETVLKNEVKRGEGLLVASITASQQYDRPDKRYDEASLIKELEKRGIGRPSTYAAILAVITNKNYIEVGSTGGKKLPVVSLVLTAGSIKKKAGSQTLGADKNKFFPTAVGSVIVDFLKKHFTEIIDYDFTAQIEGDFDRIIEKKENYLSVIKRFDGRLAGCLQELSGAGVINLQAQVKDADLLCPKCKKGSLRKGEKNWWCSAYKDGCDFKIWLEISGKKLSDAQVNLLVQNGRTAIIKGFKSKGGKDFDAALKLQEGKVTFQFEDKKS